MRKLLPALLLLVPLAACDTGPGCAEGHYETRVVYQPYEDFQGVKLGNNMRVKQVFVCDRYVEESQ